jgi:hypothetical protein
VAQRAVCSAQCDVCTEIENWIEWKQFIIVCDSIQCAARWLCVAAYSVQHGDCVCSTVIVCDSIQCAARWLCVTAYCACCYN